MKTIVHFLFRYVLQTLNVTHRIPHTAHRFLISAFCLLLSAGVSFAQPVTLDPIFGENGMMVIPNIGEIKFIDFDKLGNIIALGRNGLQLTIAKTNTNGIIDQTFGINGVITLSEYSTGIPLGMRITDDNKIFVIGIFADGWYSGYKIILMQFNEDGCLDETYGDNGKITVNSISPNIWYPNLENDNFMLVGGNDSISKYSYTGVIDESFGVNGKVNLTDNETFKIDPVCIKILNNQSVFIAGYDVLNPYDYELAFCKLSPNGNLITDFANNGIWKMNLMKDFDLDFEYFSDAIEDSNENLVLLCNFSQASTQLLFSFYPNGAINSNFGTNGYCELYPHLSWAEKILQNGNNYLVGGYDKIISITQNGILNTNFNNTGVFNCENFTFQDMKLQGGDKLILGGESSRNFALIRLNIPPEVYVKPYYPDNSITIFPNPTTGKFRISSSEFRIENIEVFDIVGSKQNAECRMQNDVDISGLKAGFYFLRIKTDVGEVIKKVVKQ